MREGKSMGIMATLKKPTPERGPLSQARVPVLEHLMCAPMYHSEGRKERDREGIGW